MPVAFESCEEHLQVLLEHADVRVTASALKTYRLENRSESRKRQDRLADLPASTRLSVFEFDCRDPHRFAKRFTERRPVFANVNRRLGCNVPRAPANRMEQANSSRSLHEQFVGVR